MTIDKSLKVKSRLSKVRSVLTRAERVAKLTEEDRIAGNSSVIGLPKTKIPRATLGKKKKEKKAEEGDDAKGKKGAKGGAKAAAAPAAAAAATKKK